MTNPYDTVQIVQFRIYLPSEVGMLWPDASDRECLAQHNPTEHGAVSHLWCDNVHLSLKLLLPETNIHHENSTEAFFLVKMHTVNNCKYCY